MQFIVILILILIYTTIERNKIILLLNHLFKRPLLKIKLLCVIKFSIATRFIF